MIGIAAQILALRQLVREALPADLVVFLGPPAGDIPDDHVAVAYDPRRAAAGRTTLSGFGNGTHSTTGSIWIALRSASGDTDDGAVAAALTKVEAWGTAIINALRADSSIAGTVGEPGEALPGRYEVGVDQADTGLSVVGLLEVVVGEHTEGGW
jgi:hypothetical protein